MKSQVLLFFVLLSPVFGQPAKLQTKFEDFPVTESTVGRAATPKLRSQSHRMFRTRIREGTRLPANFAGHYRLIEWGCGSPCSAFVVVDQKTGEVYDLPFESFAAQDFECPGTIESCLGEGLIFKPSSRLLIVDGTPSLPNGGFGRFYYEWKNHRFRLIRADIKKHGDD